jgi:prolipoprotein diacylglyceryltransferase
VPVTDVPLVLAAIPSPSTALWHLGPIPIRAYALFILIGIVAACAITELRLRQRGAPQWLVIDVAMWAVPFGLIGGRLNHLITSPQEYFGAGGQRSRYGKGGSASGGRWPSAGSAPGSPAGGSACR